MPKPEIELDYDWKAMSRVNRDEVLKRIHDVNWYQTVIYYMINPNVRKQVNVQLWLKFYGCKMPEDLKPEVEYIRQKKTNLEKVKEALKFVRKNLQYRPDAEVWGIPEYWQEAAETWKLRWNKTLKVYERSGDCEDGAILLYTICKYLGVPDYQMYLVAGDVDGGGHCYLVYVNEENGLEYPMDWCYWYADSINMVEPYRYREKYFCGDEEWFRFNSYGNYRLWTSNKGQFKLIDGRK